MTQNDILHRAQNYPYDRPDHSWVYQHGEVVPLSGVNEGLIRDRHPVLAFGSNAAPEKLRRKY